MVSQSNLKDVLPEFCGDDAPDVRQRALALLGNLAKFCPFCLWLSTSNLLNVASKQLVKSITELKKSILVANNACWVPRDTTELKESMWVANNACWAIGEIAPKMIEEMPPVLTSVISCLSLILCHPKSLNSSLVLNSTITLGKLALVCPEIVSPHMEQFMQPWCTSLSMTRDGVQKEEAFRG